MIDFEMTWDVQNVMIVLKCYENIFLWIRIDKVQVWDVWNIFLKCELVYVVLIIRILYSSSSVYQSGYRIVRLAWPSHLYYSLSHALVTTPYLGVRKGFVFILSGNALTCKSSNETIIARSTMRLEFMV